jgi:aspartyl-tRNA(Asn)/glutamyl-tRNA(Gln) amidotransferase subunit A
MRGCMVHDRAAKGYPVTVFARYSSLDIDGYKASTGVALGRRIADGELSPVQLAECALHIALSAEPSINAYAELLGERALKQAAEREAEAKSGRLRSALHGVPIAVKDNFYYQGEVTGKGSRTSPRTPAASSSPMVERLLQAGVVIIGKTTTPEFGWKGTGISPRTGITRNPWDLARNSGGSSAGSGATVASGAVPIATGTDAGGSIRIPASFCGVVGLKPTLGTIPVWPGTVNENLSHAGPITRSVEDARIVLELTRGPDARDPQSYYPRPLAEPASSLRVGIVRAPFGISPDTDVEAVISPALVMLQAAGIADFEDIDLPAELPSDVFEALWVTGRGLGFRDIIRDHADIMDPGLVRLEQLASAYGLSEFYAALTRRREFNTILFRLLDDWDLILMPTMPITAFAADAEVPDGGNTDAPLPWITWTPYTYPFNITGQPAISIPCGFGAGKMPVGLQIVGPWSQDARVLHFAQMCEEALAPMNDLRVAPVASYLPAT